MKNEINYLRLAMDESDGSFAWHFFGVNNAVAEGGYTPDPSDTVAREYLETFHAEALAKAEGTDENNSQNTLACPV